MQRRPYRHGETPADARERRRAFARELKTRVPLDRRLDRATASALSRLDETVERRLASGDHDLLLDETRIASWPRQAARLATEVDGEIMATGAAAGADPVEVARAISTTLTARFGFAPHASPTERVLVLLQAVASAHGRLAAHGWERDVLWTGTGVLARLFDTASDGASIDLTRHSGRIHLELRHGDERPGAVGTAYAVLARAGRLVIVDDARGHLVGLGEPVLTALTGVVAALDAVETFREQATD
ncbi:hypothetical protein ACPEEZ_10630 [Frigoribacterium sp. 2-23]|uniref:hypothetical protein n=1 Tax=Frigoribacterium sp. 2-23 TaxID=3415006 RepID=UPI003C6F3CB2